VEVDTSTVPAGFTQTLAGVGPDRAVDSNGSPAVVTLATDAASNLTIDFGLAPPCTGTIGDFVWEDLNGNGQQDAGEPGIGGVVVNLRDPATNALLKTTTTNSSGFYQFTGRCVGSYKVEVVPPAGYSSTLSDVPAVPDTLDSDGSPVSVVLSTSATVNLTIDFGFKKNATLCPHSWGYWKNHEQAWPVSSLTLGSKTYDKLELRGILRRSVAGDASINLAHQLIAAKFGVLKGAASAPISAAIAAADALLAAQTGKLPYNIPSSSATGAQMVSESAKLENYNTGGLTPGCVAW
jgi:hypothetical protein